jgi:hypothetical protein
MIFGGCPPVSKTYEAARVAASDVCAVAAFCRCRDIRSRHEYIIDQADIRNIVMDMLARSAV